MKLSKVGEKRNVHAAFHWTWKALVKVCNVEHALGSMFAMECSLKDLSDDFDLYKLQCCRREQIYKISKSSSCRYFGRKMDWNSPGNNWMIWYYFSVSAFNFLFLMFSGRGFAFRRKQKIERQYRKLLKKGRKVNSQQDNQFTDTYPEHLKHLYLAEEQRLKKRCRAPADSVLSEGKIDKTVE